MTEKIAFVAWNITKRSKVLAGYLNAKIITCKIASNRISKLFNYPFLIFLTFCNLIHQKVNIVIVQLPPFHASIPGYLYCKLFRKKLIYDTHSGIFFPKGLHQKVYFSLYCSMTRNTKLNIVHNEAILNRTCLKNTSSIVLECKIPFQPSGNIQHTRFIVAVICSYDKDEPIEQIIVATRLVTDIEFYLTGNSNKLKNLTLPKNVNLTGYLSDQDYEHFLRTVDIIMVLTTRPDTVLSGAYEAVGLEKPLITSDTQTLRKYFYKGSIFTSNDAKSITEAIDKARQNLDKLRVEMAELRKEKEQTWQKQFEPLQKIIRET